MSRTSKSRQIKKIGTQHARYNTGWEGKKVVLIDVATPGNNQIKKKQLEQITKYEDLKVAILRLWERNHPPFQLTLVY